jgi:hypothetical protein
MAENWVSVLRHKDVLDSSWAHSRLSKSVILAYNPGNKMVQILVYKDKDCESFECDITYTDQTSSEGVSSTVHTLIQKDSRICKDFSKCRAAWSNIVKS